MTIFFAIVLFVCLVWFLILCLMGLVASLFLPNAPLKRPPEHLDPNRWDKQHYEAYLKSAFQGPTAGKTPRRAHE